VRQRVLAALVAAAGVAGAMTMAAAGPASATMTTAAKAPAWGKAALLPGAAKLGGGADAIAVSCPSTGNCTAGGGYAGYDQVFVSSQRAGHWGNAEELPGLGALNTKNEAELDALTCPSAGNCVVAGHYNATTGQQGFVATQRNWTWAKAIEIPGLGPLNADGFSFVDSVSCGAPGNCAVGGSYADASGLDQAYVATSNDGHWGKAIEVPGTASLNAGGRAELTTLSCRSAGNCSAAGYYAPTSTTRSAFVVSERNGHWGNAIRMPGLAALDAGEAGYPATLSCGAPGYCVVGGSYRDATGHSQAFVAAQVKGSWTKAQEVRGTGTLNAGGGAQVTASSCPTAGFCSIGGFYEPKSNHQLLFVASEHAGSWSQAATLPGIASHNKGSAAQLYSLSCPAAGGCSAAGYYENASFREFAYVATEKAGHWGSVTEVPGLSGVSPGGDSGISQLSCLATGYCVGVGYGSSAAHTGEAIYVRRT
jgi:hypothetical protein